MSEPMSTELKTAIKSIERLCGEVELVSYGLAPNPTGFCYEVIETKYRDASEMQLMLRKLEDALEALNHKDTRTIIELYL